MTTIPTVCANDLPTILGTFENDPKSISVNNYYPAAGSAQAVQKIVFTSQSSAQFSPLLVPH